jgi:hypothetical protein
VRGGGGYGDAIVEFLCQGIHSSLEYNCFFPGGVVVFVQRGVLGPGYVHLLKQAIHLAIKLIKVAGIVIGGSIEN